MELEELEKELKTIKRQISDKKRELKTLEEQIEDLKTRFKSTNDLYSKTDLSNATAKRAGLASQIYLLEFKRDNLQKQIDAIYQSQPNSN